MECDTFFLSVLWEHVPYLSASEVAFHEEALLRVYVPLPLQVVVPCSWYRFCSTPNAWDRDQTTGDLRPRPRPPQFGPETEIRSRNLTSLRHMCI